MMVCEDSIGWEDGYCGIYGVVDKLNFVVVIVFDDEQVYMVEQFCYFVKGCYLEFFQGVKEGDVFFEFFVVVKVELKEECGLLVNEWLLVVE